VRRPEAKHRRSSHHVPNPTLRVEHGLANPSPTSSKGLGCSGDRGLALLADEVFGPELRRLP
jgi:hypothetical protein